MARIEWKNVDAPSFTADIMARKQASDAFNDAFAGINKSLDQWEGARRDDAMRRVVQDQMRFTDPDEYRAAVAAGQISGMDSSYLRADDIQRISGFQDTLDTRRNNRLNFEIADRTWDRTQDTWDKADAREKMLQAVTPQALSAYQAAQNNGDRQAANAILNDIFKNNPTLTMQDLTSLLGFANSGVQAFRDDVRFTQGNDSHDLNMAVGRQNLQQGATTFNNAEQDRYDQRAAEALVGTIRSLAGTVGEAGLPAAFEQALIDGNYSPRAALLAANALGIPAPANVAAAFTAGSMNSTGGPGDPYNVVYAYGRYGQPPKPLTEMTAGEWVNYGREVLIPATRGKVGAGANKGTSAMGAYQLTQETLADYAPRVLGRNWQSQPMTAEVQERIAEAVFNDRKGGELHKTWAGLPARRAGYYKNMTWDQVRGEIMQAEGTAQGGPYNQRWGSSNQQTDQAFSNDLQNFAAGGGVLRMDQVGTTNFLNAAQSVLSSADTVLAGMITGAGTITARNYATTQRQNYANANEAVTAAVGKGGALEGQEFDRAKLTRAINEVKRVNPELSYSTALNVVRESIRGTGNMFTDVTGNSVNLGGIGRVDMTHATQLARSLTGNSLNNLRQNVQSSDAGTAQIEAVRGQYETTLEAFKASMAQDQTRGGNVSAVTRQLGQQLIQLENQITSVTTRAQDGYDSFRGDERTQTRSVDSLRRTPSNGALPGQTPVPALSSRTGTPRQTIVRPNSAPVATPTVASNLNSLDNFRTRRDEVVRRASFGPERLGAWFAGQLIERHQRRRLLENPPRR